MLHDPKLDQRLENKQSYQGMHLAPTLQTVKSESERIQSAQGEYKNLLQDLAQSDFVKSMKGLRQSIIE